MKRFLVIPLACCFLSLYAKDPAMKAARKEAEKIASPIKEKLRNAEDLGFSEQDLLPDADKGKEFTAKAADNSWKQQARASETDDLQAFLSNSRKGEEIEENEQFLVEGHHLIQKPNSFTDITSLNSEIIPEESQLEACQENGTYQMAFSQTLTVKVTPEIKKTIQHCKGHQKKKSYDSKQIAKNKCSKKEASFKKDSSIASYRVKVDKHAVISSWKHKDNADSCDHFYTEEKITQEAKEEDFWNTDNPEEFSIVESNPSCKLLYTKFPQSSETRIINGKAVTRDAWLRQLHFSCEPSSDSKCATLRKQGAVLISKKCLLENSLGECDLWKKTYDLGKRGAFQQTTASFKDEEIWGLSDEFDSSYEKNTDFGSIMTTLSIFSDLENTLETQGADFHDKLKLFNGQQLKCKKSFGAGNVFDCCKGMDGVAINVKLAGCSTEEKCLAKNRKQGKCHFVGTQKVKLGTVTEHVFCCFPTKLARVVHEQGRKQLGIKWGTADKPKCRGFSFDELQRIDFSKIDLSEVVDDIPIDKTAYEGKLKGSIDSLKIKIREEIEKKSPFK